MGTDLVLHAVAATTVVAAVAGAGSAAARRAPAALRNAIWRVALLAFWVIPFAVLVSGALNLRSATIRVPVLPAERESRSAARYSPPATQPRAHQEVVPAGVAVTAAPAPCRTPPPDFGAVLLWIWAAGGLLAALAYVRQARLVRRLSRASSPVTDAMLIGPVAHWATAVGLRRPPMLAETTTATVPLVIGLRSPMFLLPHGFLASQPGRDAVIVHELAHIRRHDLLVHALGRLTCALWWWHPLAWIAARGLRLSAEEACDDWAIAVFGRRREYAELLVQWAETAQAGAGSACAFGGRHLLRRVRRVLEERRTPVMHLSWRMWATLAACALIIVPPSICLRAQAVPAKPLGAASSRTAAPPDLGEEWAIPSDETLARHATSPAPAAARDRLLRQIAALLTADWQPVSAAGDVKYVVTRDDAAEGVKYNYAYLTYRRHDTDLWVESRDWGVWVLMRPAAGVGRTIAALIAKTVATNARPEDYAVTPDDANALSSVWQQYIRPGSARLSTGPRAPRAYVRRVGRAGLELGPSQQAQGWLGRGYEVEMATDGRYVAFRADSEDAYGAAVRRVVHPSPKRPAVAPLNPEYVTLVNRDTWTTPQGDPTTIRGHGNTCRIEVVLRQPWKPSSRDAARRIGTSDWLGVHYSVASEGPDIPPGVWHVCEFDRLAREALQHVGATLWDWDLLRDLGNPNTRRNAIADARALRRDFERVRQRYAQVKVANSERAPARKIHDLMEYLAWQWWQLSQVVDQLDQGAGTEGHVDVQRRLADRVSARGDWSPSLPHGTLLESISNLEEEVRAHTASRRQEETRAQADAVSGRRS